MLPGWWYPAFVTALFLAFVVYMATVSSSGGPTSCKAYDEYPSMCGIYLDRFVKDSSSPALDARCDMKRDYVRCQLITTAGETKTGCLERSITPKPVVRCLHLAATGVALD